MVSGWRPRDMGSGTCDLLFARSPRSAGGCAWRMGCHSNDSVPQQGPPHRLPCLQDIAWPLTLERRGAEASGPRQLKCSAADPSSLLSAVAALGLGPSRTVRKVWPANPLLFPVSCPRKRNNLPGSHRALVPQRLQVGSGHGGGKRINSGIDFLSCLFSGPITSLSLLPWVRVPQLHSYN